MSRLPSALHIAHRTLHITDCTLHILQPAVGEQDQENQFVRRGQACDGDVLNSRVSASWCEDIDGDLQREPSREMPSLTVMTLYQRSRVICKVATA